MIALILLANSAQRAIHPADSSVYYFQKLAEINQNGNLNQRHHHSSLKSVLSLKSKPPTDLTLHFQGMVLVRLLLPRVKISHSWPILLLLLRKDRDLTNYSLKVSRSKIL